MQEKILILDFGSQYTQLIARRVRELNVYCEIYPYNHYPALDSSVKGVILSGSPFSVRDDKAPQPDLTAIKGQLPLLGVCFGAQYLAHHFGGEVKASNKREYGRANLAFVDKTSKLFKGIGDNSQVWMSHGDPIEKLPAGCQVIASTKDVQNAAFKVENEITYGIQFHPEVYHSTEGTCLLRNFVVGICGCSQNWTPDSFVETTVAELKQKLGDDRVILGLSGGVDSTVAAMLLHRAVGKNLTCIFVDNGLLRKDEYKTVLENYKELGLNVVGAESGDLFLGRLAGVTEPEKKRKIIGSTFIDVFDQEASKIEDAKWLGQGTIYPDVIESLSVNGPSQTIKSHHNVDKFLQRHPFPGPGLAIRILGEITPEKVRLLQEADHIFISMLQEEGLYNKVWQAGVMLLPVQSVGVMGDERTYESVVALRAVESTDGMTADWCHLPYEFLARVSNRIINNVRGINRVVYDISSKPPATIEWE